MSTTKQQKVATLDQIYHENDFIDARDNQGDWRVGYIVGKFEHVKTFKIRFDGWPSKYDESFRFNSLKLRHFRSVVIGYTGQQQNPAIRQWKFVSSQHQQRVTKVRQFFSSPEKFSVLELNQILRGHNYLYNDFLMTWKFQSSEGISAAIDYFFMNVDFLVKYLKNISINFTEFLKIISNQPQISDISIKEAFYLSFYEVFDTGFIISGNYMRLNGFFRDNGELIKEYFKDSSKRQAKKVYQIYIISRFIREQGLQTIQAIITKLLSSEELIPFLFLQSITNLYFCMSTMIGTVDREAIIKNLITIGQDNFSKLKDHHFKDLHKHHVINYLVAMINLANNSSFSENILQWSIELELKLSLKMIECPYFQKKLKGISYIISICQKNEDILKNEFFKTWSIKVKLFQILFLNNDNQQFIKKSCQLVKFLHIKDNITDDDVDLIWKSRIGKHQTSVKEIYTLIGQFPFYQKEEEEKLKLFSKISNLPEKQWEDDYIKMIKQFSENSYGLNIREKLESPFGFYMVYEYAKRTASQTSIVLLTQLLHKVQKSQIYNTFQVDCFNNISMNISPWIHIKILLYMCNNRIETLQLLEINMIEIVINFLINNTANENGKIMVDGLQLLGEVVKGTNKDIQIDQMMSLWNSFIKSTHRQSFIKWLFRKKDNGRVICNSCLNQGLRSHFLEQLWNQPSDIKQIDQNQAIFFIQLFKNVNTFNQKIKRTNIIIRPLSLQLTGYEKLWTILKVTQKPAVVNIVADFIAQIHTSFEEDNFEVSIETLVENITGQMQICLKTQNTDYLTRLLLLTEKLISRDQQIFSFSYHPRVNYIREYTVTYKSKNEQKIIRFNCMSTFYEFKKQVSEKFSIPLDKLVVYNNKHEVIKLQNYFKTMNENQYVNYKFQIIQEEEKESLVKNCLNYKLDLFFVLLDDKRIEKLVWSIVEKLPISDELKFKIIQTEDILEELQKVGFYKELYQLKVMLELSSEWWQKFIKNQNLNLLIANLNKVKFTTHIELEYLATLSEIIQKLLRLNNKQQQKLNISSNLLRKVFDILKDLLINIEKNGSKNLRLQIKIIRNLFGIGQTLKISLNHEEIIRQFLNNENIQQLIMFGLISNCPQQIRKKFNEQLRKFIHQAENDQLIQMLDILVIKLFEKAINYKLKNNLKEYFEFTSFVLSKSDHKYIKNFIQKKAKNLCNKIYLLVQQENPQIQPQNSNIALIGYLSLLKHLAWFETNQSQMNIAQFILFKCLFSDHECKCKSKKSRWEAFNLIKSLFANSKIIQFVCNYLSQFHKVGKWRTRRLDDWTITIHDKMKSNTGYVGLKNLGCICYMNSFMQQLYMIPHFRHSITSCVDPFFNKEVASQNLLFQIQKMFLNLWNSDKKFYNPKDFCHSFKDYDGNPTNVSQQMDIDQFSNILFDRVQSQLKPTSQQTLIKDMFGGIFSNQIVCKGCPHYSETQETFLSISLTVKSKKNIYQSFDTMIKGDTLDGDNAYFCERCSKKVSAVKRVSLKKLPNYLIVTLKRFQFDYQKMIKLKVNDYCQFPINLNLKQYSRQFLRKKQSTKQIEEQQDQSNQYYNYVLKGFVVHMGYADSGHYYSFIQDRGSSKWYEFNDTVVRQFNIDDMPQQAFGGEYGGYDAKEKIKNAYMLIYERQKKIQVDKVQLVPKQQIIKKQSNAIILQEILNENKQQKIQNILFSAEYNRFINQILDNLDQYDEQMQKIILKYTITVFLTITIRQKSDNQVYNRLKKIQSNLNKHSQLKEWVISLFSEDKIVEEFFKNNLIRQIKKVLAYWLIDLYQYCNRESQVYFCNVILNKLTEDNENALQFCMIFYQISKNSSKSLDYLVSKNIVGRYIENIVRKQPRLYIEKQEIIQVQKSQIGNQIVIERTLSELNIKKLKFDNENAYVWAMINIIIKRGKDQSIQLDKYITKEQYAYLWLQDTKIYKILQEAKNKLQIYEFTNFLAYLTTGNKQFVILTIQLIFSGLKQFQSKRYRQFFLLFEKIVNVQDQFKDLRLSGFKKMVEALMHNEQYSLDSNIIQQWIVILINRNQNLRNYVASQDEILQYLFKLTAKKTPSDQIARKNSVYGQFMINKFHGVKFPKSKKGYTKITENIAEFYSQIIQKKFTQSPHWPSVAETQQNDLKVGQTVAYFDTKDKIDYEQAKILSIFISRVELQIKERIINIWKDDQKINLDIKLIANEQDNQLNSSRTTQMDIEEDEYLFEQL